jgi:hypothetical protein
MFPLLFSAGGISPPSDGAPAPSEVLPRTLADRKDVVPESAAGAIIASHGKKRKQPDSPSAALSESLVEPPSKKQKLTDSDTPSMADMFLSGTLAC